jgi:hypothetical protein
MKLANTFKLFAAIVAIAASALPGLASAKTWGTVDGFTTSATWNNLRPTTTTNYYILRGSGGSQNLSCQNAYLADKAYYQSSLAVQLHQIAFSASRNINYTRGCAISDLSYYGDLEYQLELFDIRTGSEVLVSRKNGNYRLDTSLGNTTPNPSLSIAFPSTMQPGRYRARAWTRVVGKDDWRQGTIDFTAKVVPIGQIEKSIDRCGNPDRPSCGIRPRFHVEGWACDPIATSGTFTPSKLVLHEHPLLDGSGYLGYPGVDIIVPLNNFKIVSRPDIVTKKYCKSSSVGFSYDFDGDSYYNIYVLRYNDQLLQGGF